MELPYKSKFDSLPEIELKQLVEYFNLEYGIAGVGKEFVESDFSYEGLYIIDGAETMVWAVNECEVCALVKPFEDSYIIEMGEGPK